MASIQTGYLKTKNGTQLFTTVPYPVGAIYLSMDSTDPSKLFGGTWEQIKGRFLLGTGVPNDNSNTYYGSDLTYDGVNKFNQVVGDTGGTSLVTLSISQIPSHTHIQNSHFHWVTSRMTSTGGDNGSGFQITNRNGGSGSNNYWLSAGGYNDAGYQNKQSVGALSTTATNQNTGGGQFHNNMPPYLAVYMWKRIA